MCHWWAQLGGDGGILNDEFDSMLLILFSREKRLSIRAKQRDLFLRWSPADSACCVQRFNWRMTLVCGNEVSQYVMWMWYLWPSQWCKVLPKTTRRLSASAECTLVYHCKLYFIYTAEFYAGFYISPGLKLLWFRKIQVKGLWSMKEGSTAWLLLCISVYLII